MNLRNICHLILGLPLLACSVLALPVFGADEGGSTDRYVIQKGLSFSETAKDLRLDLYLPKEAP